MDDFTASFSDEDLDVLLRLGSELGFEPYGAVEALLAERLREWRATGDPVEALRARLARDFRCVGARPEWVQAAEWPVRAAPLLFVGQLAVPVRTVELGGGSRLVHRGGESVAFVFLDEDSGEFVVVRQWW